MPVSSFNKILRIRFFVFGFRLNDAACLAQLNNRPGRKEMSDNGERGEQ